MSNKAKNENLLERRERLLTEIDRFSISYDIENEVYSVVYLEDYEVLIQPELVDMIASESGKRKELIAMILGTTKIIRNLTPGKPDKVSDSLILASICELLTKYSPLKIATEFLYNMVWYQIEEILKEPEKAVEFFAKRVKD